MKTNYLSFAILFVFLLLPLVNISGQAQDIELIEEREDRVVRLYAQNHTDDELDMTLTAQIIGFETKDANPVKKLLGPKAKELLLTLTAPKGVACEYQTSVSYKKVRKPITGTEAGRKNRTTGVELNPTKINVFTQDGCGRCEFVVKYLQDNNIPFLELNTSIHDPNQTKMFEILQEAGFKGNSVQMPVVVQKDKTEYNIKDLASWVKKMNK
jgi:glutaredoxin